MINLAIFDLDGTLINSIEDLLNATNYALDKCSFLLILLKSTITL